MLTITCGHRVRFMVMKEVQQSLVTWRFPMHRLVFTLEHTKRGPWALTAWTRALWKIPWTPQGNTTYLRKISHDEIRMPFQFYYYLNENWLMQAFFNGSYWLYESRLSSDHSFVLLWACWLSKNAAHSLMSELVNFKMHNHHASSSTYLCCCETCIILDQFLPNVASPTC